MAKPSDKASEYVERARKMNWKKLQQLWESILNDSTPGWDEGKALEHLVIRAFELDSLPVEYPYDVPPGGRPIEQIDGLVQLHCLTFLIECKDKTTVDIEAIAKLRNQLLRRPETTFGCVFSAGKFTDPARILTDFALPHRILLWSGFDIERCLKQKAFAPTLEAKYRDLCRYGLTDHSPYYQDLRV